MQVDPNKPKLKPPGTKRLKLQYYNLLSNFGFKFNLRRYIKAAADAGDANLTALGGAVQVDSIKTRVECAPGFSA